MTLPKVDLVVVGAGVVGRSCALAAARLGKRIAVVDRDAQANGASIRSFGFVTAFRGRPSPPSIRAERARRVAESAARLTAPGADLVVESVADLIPALDARVGQAA